jgi:hypothetical protein
VRRQAGVLGLLGRARPGLLRRTSAWRTPAVDDRLGRLVLVDGQVRAPAALVGRLVPTTPAARQTLALLAPCIGAAQAMSNTYRKLSPLTFVQRALVRRTG